MAFIDRFRGTLRRPAFMGSTSEAKTLARYEIQPGAPGSLGDPNRQRWGGESLFAKIDPAKDAPISDRVRIDSIEGNPIAMACVRKIAWNTASVKFGVEFLNGELDFDHPIAQRIEEPNSEGGKWGLIQLIAASLAVCGRAYVFGLPALMQDSAPASLIFLRPDHVRRVWNIADGTVSHYEYNTLYRGVVRLDPATICEIKHPWLGDTSALPGSGRQEAYSQMTAAWGPLSLYTGLTGLMTKLLHNNGGLPGILTWSAPKQDEALTKEQRKTLREYIESFRSDGERFGKIAFLDSAGAKIDFVKITEDFKSLNMQEGKKAAMEEICGVFGVPPLLLMGNGEGATFANMAEARRSFWMETVLPGYVNVIAGALSSWLGVKISPDLTEIPALADYRVTLAQSLAVMDYLTINEKRGMMGFEAVLGGDVLMLNPAMLPLNRIINSQTGSLADEAEWLSNQEQVRDMLRTGIMPGTIAGRGPAGQGGAGAKALTTGTARPDPRRLIQKNSRTEWETIAQANRPGVFQLPAPARTKEHRRVTTKSPYGTYATALVGKVLPPDPNRKAS